MYPGDYYVKNPNPILDDVFIYTGFFGQTNPQNGYYVEGDWTGTFNTPGIRFTPGMGVAVWVDDKQPDATIHEPFDFYFPKYDPSYLIYTWEGNVLHTHTANREDSHRFVYEEGEVWNRSTGEITLPVSASGADKKVIVGNPFMAHWDFASFREQNPIKDYYQILDENGQNFTTYIQYGTGGTVDPGITITTANPPLDRYIAPMQSVLVESTAAFSSLKTHVTHTSVQAGAKLRVSPRNSCANVLFIDASINDRINRTALVAVAGDPSGEYDSGIPKVLLKEGMSLLTDNEGNVIADYPYPINVYTISEEGHLFDIRFLTGEQELIPLGISTLQQGVVRLSFSGINDFYKGCELYFINVHAGLFPSTINLRERSFYEFEKQDHELFVNDRFYLKIVPSGTHVQTPVPEMENVQLVRQGNTLRLISLNGENIEEVIISDMHGRILSSEREINKKEVVLHPANNGLYMIRCSTRTSNHTFKIYE